MLSDSYLFNAGWLFFAAWSVVVAVVSVAAFGPDVFPSKTPLNPTRESNDAEPPIPHILP